MSIFTCKLCLKQQEILYVRGERTVAISGVLLEGRITFKTYVDKGEGGGVLQSEDFRRNIIYGWSLIVNHKVFPQNER